MDREHFDQIGQQMANEQGSTAGQMFGKPCLKINNKAFAAFFKGQMVFKLGREEVTPLLDQYPGSVNWDPSGKKRPMKDWLQVPEEYQADWEKLAHQALAYVAEQS